VRALLRSPGVQQWWKRAAHTVDPEFVAELEQATENGESAA